MKTKKNETCEMFENEEERKVQGRTWKLRLPSLPIWLTALLLLAASAGMGVMSMYFGCGSYKLELLGFLLADRSLVLLNTLPLVLLTMLLWLLTDRPVIGALGSGLVCLAWSWAEYWKLMARSEPIYAEDLTLIREAAKMSGQYVSFTWQIGLSLVLVVGTVTFFALFGRRRLHHLPVRLVLVAALATACYGLYTGVYTDDTRYSAYEVAEGFNQWNSRDRYLCTGSLYPFIHTIPSAFHTAPEGYSAKEAAALLAEYEESEIPEDKKVSVVCVMLEAMADFSKYTDVITGEDPYAVMHQLQAESYSGELVTNIFAGGTFDTERCVLTGFPALGTFRVPSWSYARYFEQQGYLLDGAHAGHASFYSREVVNANLGFSSYRFEENYYWSFMEGIPWDSVFFPDLTEVCLEDMEQGPLFSYNVSYQNHGPYSTDTANFEREYVPEGAVDTETWYMLNNYLAGVESTWNYIREMVDAFAASEEPIVLVLFGDHKPWMGDQNSGYDALGIDLNVSTLEGFCNYYTTDYLIWANDAAREKTGGSFEGEGPRISGCYLMNLLFEQCGWDGPAWLKQSNEVRELLPVVTSVGKYLWEDAVVGSDQVSEEARQRLDAMYVSRYYLEYDYMKEAG